MKRIYLGVVMALLITGAIMATEREKSLYKTHKLSIGTVAIECTDGRKPMVKVLENSPILLVSCPLGRNQD